MLNDEEMEKQRRKSEPACECPGWCAFNPGQHHANCKCQAKEHWVQKSRLFGER